MRSSALPVLLLAGLAHADGAAVRFGPQKKVEWKGVEGQYRVWKTDLDKDGDADLLLRDAKKITWVENQGGGTFAHREISATFANPESLATGDLDGDGDLDLVAISACNASQGCAGVTWFENLGKARAFEPHALSTEGLYATFGSVAIGDVDGDGKADVLYADKLIRWFKNLGGKKFAKAEELENKERSYRELVAGDLDGDKDADLVAFADGKLVYLNNDKGALTEKALTTERDEVVNIALVDMTQDGLPDLLINWGTKVEVQQNLEGKAFSADNVTESRGTVDIAGADAADFDGDGDLDVLVGRGNDTQWVENENATWKKAWPIIEHNGTRAGLWAGDADKDGDPDLLGVMQSMGSSLVWVELKGARAAPAKAPPAKGKGKAP